MTQRKPETSLLSLVDPTERALDEMSTQTLPDANPPPHQMTENNQSKKPPGYLTITSNPGPIAKLLLDLFGFSQNTVQVPISVEFELSSNLSMSSSNESLHDEQYRAVNLSLTSRQEAMSTSVEAVSPSIEVDRTNGSSDHAEAELKKMNLETTPIRSWVWIFGISSSVAALCVISVVSFRLSATRGIARQPEDPPTGKDG